MAVALYARQSLDRDGQGAAVDRQVAACRDLAERHGLTVDREYIDNDVSASKGLRPGFLQLLEAVRAGQVDTILVWHTDRLYRRVRDLVDLVEVAEKHSLRILTVRAGDLDLGTPAGRMLAGMLGHAARYEVEQKGARQVAANAQRAERGEYQFSRRPYGYQRVAGEVVIVEDEAAVLREAFDRYLAGESYYSIVEDFNSRGIPTTTSKPWSITTLRDRLNNPAYAGRRLYKGRDVGEGSWTPIISADTWAAYKRMRSNRGRPAHWSNQVKYLLTGLAICSKCGSRLLSRPSYGRQKTGPRSVHMTYACTQNWCVQRAQEPVDRLVVAVLLERLARPDAADLLRPAETAEPLEEEARELRERWDGLAELLADGILRPTAVREQQAKLRTQLDSLQHRIDLARGGSELVAIVTADDVQAVWDRLSLPKRRALISTLMEVTIRPQAHTRIFDPEDVVIDWRTG